MYRADGARSAQLWAICAVHVDDRANDRIMKARGTCPAQTMLDLLLSFDADGVPHARHANLVGWPMPKHEWKDLQQKIADPMSLEMRPEA
jgi:hypothetical protein